MSANRLVFRVHAVQRMFQRHISKDDDTPYPSRLMLGWCGPRPLHVVVADNMEDQERIVITVYEPDLTEWEQGFSRRKSS